MVGTDLTVCNGCVGYVEGFFWLAQQAVFIGTGEATLEVSLSKFEETQTALKAIGSSQQLGVVADSASFRTRLASSKQQLKSSRTGKANRVDTTGQTGVCAHLTNLVHEVVPIQTFLADSVETC